LLVVKQSLDSSLQNARSTSHHPAILTSCQGSIYKHVMDIMWQRIAFVSKRWLLTFYKAPILLFKLSHNYNNASIYLAKFGIKLITENARYV